LPFGFCVALAKTIEGLVHVSNLRGDYYEFDERSFALRGQRNGRVFRIGDTVRVRLVRVDEEMGQIDFQWLPERKNVSP
ncbi:MAG: S1 RNA-binding domain-containing protein, partial [Syntrophomonadaceae bacterium]|nr:S1 RNA-binding domain-containing protein [Syntrophomonadaceae bacterium]